MRTLFFVVTWLLAMHQAVQAQEFHEPRLLFPAHARSICAGIGSVRGHSCMEEVRLIERTMQRNTKLERMIATMQRRLDILSPRMEAYKLTRYFTQDTLRHLRRRWNHRYEVPSR